MIDNDNIDELQEYFEVQADKGDDKAKVISVLLAEVASKELQWACFMLASHLSTAMDRPLSKTERDEAFKAISAANALIPSLPRKKIYPI